MFEANAPEAGRQVRRGDPLLPEDGEVAMFWPCGLTALAALRGAGLPLFFSHTAGAMLVTDLQEPEPV
ncbi:MAG: DUF1445 domain-containing protein [Devosia sp.]|nr:DUF1445 domain-containing protein [Devosia sp.]